MTNDNSWRQASHLVAVDLEGSGAQDRDAEAILEVAAIRLIDGLPELRTAFSTLLNPQRRIRPAPWISPHLTDQALALAPTLEQVTPSLIDRLDGAVLVGHNVTVDWRLLHRRIPQLRVAGLIDTVKLARKVLGRGEAGLTALLDRLQVTDRVNAAVPAGRPHRALWDAAGAAVLLDELVRRHWRHELTLAALLAASAPSGHEPAHPSLFDQSGTCPGNGGSA